MDCYCDFEQPKFITRKFHIARKKHKCCECGKTIFSGEKYEYVSGLWDNYFDVYKTCSCCIKLRSAFSEMECFCWYYGGLKESITLHMEETDFPPGGKFSYLRLIIEHKNESKRANNE